MATACNTDRTNAIREGGEWKGLLSMRFLESWGRWGPSSLLRAAYTQSCDGTKTQVKGSINVHPTQTKVQLPHRMLRRFLLEEQLGVGLLMRNVKTEIVREHERRVVYPSPARAEITLHKKHTTPELLLVPAIVKKGGMENRIDRGASHDGVSTLNAVAHSYGSIRWNTVARMTLPVWFRHVVKLTTCYDEPTPTCPRESTT